MASNYTVIVLLFIFLGGETIIAFLLKEKSRRLFIVSQFILLFFGLLCTFLINISNEKQIQGITDTTNETKRITDNINRLENLDSSLTSENNRLARLDSNLTSHISIVTEENKQLTEDVKTISKSSRNVISKIEGLQRYPLLPLDISVSYMIAISKNKYDSLLELLSPTTQSKLPYGFDIDKENLYTSDAKFLKLVFDARFFLDFKKTKNQISTMNNAFDPDHFWIELSMQNKLLEYLYFKSTPLGSDTVNINVGCKFLDVLFNNRSHSNVFSVKDLDGWYLYPFSGLGNCDNCRFEINGISFFARNLSEYYPITQFSYSKEENYRRAAERSGAPEYKKIKVRL